MFISPPDQTIMEEANVLQTSAVEGSRTTLDESVMPPPSSQRGLKRKSQDTEPALPVSTCQKYNVGTYCFLHSISTLFSLDGSSGPATTATTAAGVQRL